ncbi:MAG: hypothetical protein J3Q66DRAFT_370982 [Benniella sp.]|nr:MAG: hypothetical protein J3Q66DRAFT_370982 [Benniella sp.]
MVVQGIERADPLSGSSKISEESCCDPLSVTKTHLTPGPLERDSVQRQSDHDTDEPLRQLDWSKVVLGSKREAPTWGERTSRKRTEHELQKTQSSSSGSGENALHYHYRVKCTSRSRTIREYINTDAIPLAIGRGKGEAVAVGRGRCITTATAHATRKAWMLALENAVAMSETHVGLVHKMHLKDVSVTEKMSPRSTRTARPQGSLDDVQKIDVKKKDPNISRTPSTVGLVSSSC